MKKNIILSVITLFMLSACNTPTVMKSTKCTLSSSTNTVSTEMEYTIDYEEDEIKKVRMNYSYKDLTNTNTDGINTGTDGTTNDTNIDKDGIIDGIVGETLGDIIGGMKDVILDVAGIKDRHAVIQNAYNDINGFSVSNITDVDNNYKVSYVIDYDNITDDELQRLNLSRELNTLKDNYTNQGFTCK